jgi:ethanolamine utilization protein EutQ (cupin superfamily)
MTAVERASLPPFRVVSDAWRELPSMAADYPGTLGFIGDVYANPEGCPMASGYFALHHTDEPLDYYYDYDEMKVVLEGEFRLENKDTGQVMIAREKDAIFFPQGSRILFSTPSRALAFYVGYRSFAP